MEEARKLLFLNDDGELPEDAMFVRASAQEVVATRLAELREERVRVVRHIDTLCRQHLGEFVTDCSTPSAELARSARKEINRLREENERLRAESFCPLHDWGREGADCTCSEQDHDPESKEAETLRGDGPVKTRGGSPPDAGSSPAGRGTSSPSASAE